MRQEQGLLGGSLGRSHNHGRGWGEIPVLPSSLPDLLLTSPPAPHPLCLGQPTWKPESKGATYKGLEGR